MDTEQSWHRGTGACHSGLLPANFRCQLNYFYSGWAQHTCKLDLYNCVILLRRLEHDTSRMARCPWLWVCGISTNAVADDPPRAGADEAARSPESGAADEAYPNSSDRSNSFDLESMYWDSKEFIDVGRAIEGDEPHGTRGLKTVSLGPRSAPKARVDTPLDVGIKPADERIFDNIFGGCFGGHARDDDPYESALASEYYVNAQVQSATHESYPELTPLQIERRDSGRHRRPGDSRAT